MVARWTAAALLQLSFVAAIALSPECQLNGVFTPGVGCTCEPSWTGASCEYLNLQPADPSAGLHMAGNSSWGGTVVFDKISQRWNMFVSIFEEHCGLAEWQPNSAIARASSDSPGGSYRLEEVLLHNFAHSPDARVQPDGSIVIYHIYNSSASTCRNCSDGVSGTGPGCEGWLAGTHFFGYWGALHAPSAAGPWSVVRLGSCDPAAADYVPGCTANGNDLNPTGVTDAVSGAVSLVWRSIAWATQGRSFVAAAAAPSWRGPFSYNTTSLFGAEQAAAGIHIEDPFLYRGPEGGANASWHVLMHADVDGSCGGAAGMHGWSVDGVSWSLSAVNAFCRNVTLVNGTVATLARRERPKLIFDAAGAPTHLVSSAAWGGAATHGDATFTMIQPLVTR